MDMQQHYKSSPVVAVEGRAAIKPQHQQQLSPPKPQPLTTATTPSSTISLADIDPKSVPEHLKIEGSDWFAL
jgi:hypothetical protein